MGFFKYGELPLVLLALLGRGELNGYELIGALGKAFGPAYSPSPGSIYPALAGLERAGLVRGEDVDGTKRYALTEVGADALESRAEELGRIELRTGTYLRDSDIWMEVARLDAALRNAEGTVDPELLRRVVRRARTSVQALLDEEGEP